MKISDLLLYCGIRLETGLCSYRITDDGEAVFLHVILILLNGN